MHNKDFGTLMKLDDFRSLPKGTKVKLHYNDVNFGAFEWIHDRVEGTDVIGQFQYPDMYEPSKVGPFLYEHDGYVCRGSGAERCRAGWPRTDLMGYLDLDSLDEEEEEEFY